MQYYCNKIKRDSKQIYKVKFKAVITDDKISFNENVQMPTLLTRVYFNWWHKVEWTEIR